jgi:predicted dehydrogenase/threonine dehydrogenase-like Zn-dependent dehydrogenase
MKQILQDLESGELIHAEVPSPSVRAGHVLIQSRCSLISAGTERMLTDFAKAGYIEKARQQPDKVKQVLDKVRTDGLAPTVEAVRSKLAQPLPMGYCNVGKVLAVDEGVTTLKPGDRVASNGNHAEVVCVPQNLCAKIPDDVTDEQATFTVLGSIALQGIRLLQPTLGESIAVFGLGLIGLLAVQQLKANGCRVIGFDFNSDRVKLAAQFGAETVDLSTGADPVRAAELFTDGHGIDGVLITASTKSDELIHQAAEMSRQRGRIILTGVIGLKLRRDDFYKKELTFQVSCSYGPGRYDPSYEEQGKDYPAAYVRWTEQRNLSAVLEMLKTGAICVGDLISGRHDFDKAPEAYAALSDSTKIGLILEYADANDPESLTATTVKTKHAPNGSRQAGSACFGIIGAGQFTQLKILPGLAKAGARLKCIASAGGVSSAIAARKTPVENLTTDASSILSDSEIDTVVVSTRHNSHARYVIEALKVDKNVFVEKPLCMTTEELQQIEIEHAASRERTGREPLLMVGYNRRFSPHAQKAKAMLRSRQAPMAATFLCNAGEIPADHWVHDPEVGGGRLIGEVCHFIDFMHFLTGSAITRISTAVQRPTTGPNLEDTLAVQMEFADGSVGSVCYFANGTKSFPKERCEIFFDGQIIQIDNFKKSHGFGGPKLSNGWMSGMDKGHNDQFEKLVQAIKTGSEAPISFEETVHVMKATLAAIESMHSGAMITV